MVEEYGQDTTLYKRLKDPELYDGQHIANMTTTICQCRIMIEREIWTTGNKVNDKMIMQEIKELFPLKSIYLRYAYDSNDNPNKLCILEMKILP